MNYRMVIIGLSLACAPFGQAYAADSMRLAVDLGNVLGSEKACGLSYDQSAIEKFIETRVKDDDLSFPSHLTLMTSAGEREAAEMSTSAKTAHCMQIKRLAKKFGFVQ